jgi:hypothetical protein
MTTSLNSDAPKRDAGYAYTQAIRKTVAFSDFSATATSVVIGMIPANALVVAGVIATTTAFNNTTSTLTVGYTNASATTAATAYATIANAGIATAGSIAFDEVSTVNNVMQTVSATVIAQMNGALSTAGSADIVVRFVTSSPFTGT